MANGSHGSSEFDLRAKHKAVSQDFQKAVEKGAFDEARVWDNHQPEGQPLTLIFEVKDGVQTIHDEKLWLEFVAKASESID